MFCFVKTSCDQDYPESILHTKQRNKMLKHVENNVHEGDRTFEGLVGGHRIDLIEVCAPWDSPLRQAVRELGGTALALGIHNGYDLTTQEGYRKAISTIRELRPRYLHISPPCFLWSSFQNCTKRNEQQRQEFEHMRCSSKRLITRCARLLEIQLKELDGQGGHSDTFHGGGEHPLRAQSWRATNMGHMARMCGGRFTVHGCCHGMIDPN